MLMVLEKKLIVWICALAKSAKTILIAHNCEEFLSLLKPGYKIVGQNRFWYNYQIHFCCQCCSRKRWQNKLAGVFPGLMESGTLDC